MPKQRTRTCVNIVNPYDTTDKIDIVAHLFGRRLASGLEKGLIRLASRFYERYIDRFHSLEIETINRCNNTCSFCPVNAKDDPRPLARMQESTFRKIAGELAEMDYRGEIALYSNNEPYLDKQLVPRIRHLREKCPHAYIYVLTNGLVAEFEEIIDSLNGGLDHITIDNYNDELVLNDKTADIVARLEQPCYHRYLDRITVVLLKKTEIRTNRGGTAPNKPTDTYMEFKHYTDAGCTLPFRQLVVRPSGEVSLCCNDALGRVTLGDVNKQTLREIWHGPAYGKLRRELLRNGRRNLPVCKVCDISYVSKDLRNMLSHWRQTRASRL